jgi:pyruvate dehydrogenase E1 component alpha subunit
LYEAMNMAALWKLPVIYVCEANLYGEYTQTREAAAGEVMARPQASGIPVKEVDGQEVRAVQAAAKEIVERARRGGGPGFLVCHTYRFRGHHVGDINRSHYRSAEEEEAWSRERDPIRLLGLFLIRQRLADAPTLEKIDQNVRAEIAAGVKFALEAPYPDPSEVTQNVYP